MLQRKELKSETSHKHLIYFIYKLMYRQTILQWSKFLSIMSNMTIIIKKFFKKIYKNFYMNATKFIVKLAEMMKEFPKIINWSSEGREIEILDIERFTVEVQPKYFENPNYKSFLRQLNMYSFKKLTKRKNSVTFSHPQFRRGNQQHFQDIKRRPKNKIVKSSKKSEKKTLVQAEDNTVCLSSLCLLLDHQEIMKTISMIKKQISDKGVLLIQKLQRMLLKGATSMGSRSLFKLSENSSTQQQKQHELIHQKGDVYGLQFSFEPYISNSGLYFQE